jgi:hypothetical protein
MNMNTSNSGGSKAVIFGILLLLGVFLVIGLLKGWGAAGIFIAFNVVAAGLFIAMPESIFATGPAFIALIAYISYM